MTRKLIPQLATTFALGLVAAAHSDEPTMSLMSAAAPGAASISERVSAAFEALTMMVSPGAPAAVEPPAAPDAPPPLPFESSSLAQLPAKASSSRDNGQPARKGQEATGVVERSKAGDTSAGAVASEGAAVAKGQAPDAGTGEGWSVQLNGGKSEAEARTAYAQVRRKHAALIAGREAMILKKWLSEDQGHWHYVRLAATSRERATRLCTRLSAVGEPCLVVANEALKEPIAR
jgi:SPOR domain